MSHIKREKVPAGFREQDEVTAAYEQVGKFPAHRKKDWYGGIYEFYQDNEC